MNQGNDFGPEGDCFERMSLACPTDVLVAALQRMEEELYK